MKQDWGSIRSRPWDGKIDYVLIEHAGLPFVLTLAVHLGFEGPLLHA